MIKNFFQEDIFLYLLKIKKNVITNNNKPKINKQKVKIIQL